MCSPLWSASSAYTGPKGVFIWTVRKLRRQVGFPRTQVPEENAEGVSIDSVVVLLTEQLGRHVDRGADHGTRYHCVGFAEAKIGDFRSVVVVQ